MANSGGTKLIKIASAINIGKETIVAFLKERGYAIENKVTTSLTNEMVDVVHAHFQKELTQAERSRQRAEERKKHDDPHPSGDSAHASTTEHSSEPVVASVVHDIPHHADTMSSSVAENNTASVSESTSDTNPSLVGTVIALDGLVSGRKTTKKKETSKQSVVITEEAFVGEPTKAEPVKAEPMKAEPIASETAKSEAMPTASHDTVPPVSAPSATSTQTVVAPTQENAPQRMSEPSTNIEHKAQDAEKSSVEATDDHDDHAAKKRKKRMMGELEYKADEVSPANAPQGLTILGKIDLNPRGRRRDDGSGRQEQRGDMRRDNQGMGGNRRDDRGDNRTDNRGDNRFPPRTDNRSDNRGDNRFPPRTDNRGDNRFPPRTDNRGDNRFPPRTDNRSDNRFPPRTDNRSDNRFPPRTDNRGDNRTDNRFPPRTDNRGDNRTDNRFPPRTDNRSDNRFPRTDNRDPRRDTRPQEPRPSRPDFDARFDTDDDDIATTREPLSRFEGKPIVRTTTPDANKPQRVFGTMGPSRDDDRNKKKRKKGSVRREEVNQEEVERAIRRTLSGGEDSMLVARNKLRQKRKIERAEEQARQAELDEAMSSVLRVTEFITAAELANLMRVQVNDIILKSMQLGLMVSINQRLDKDSITLIADDYGYSIEFEEEFSVDAEEDDDDDESTLVYRAPIVTIMGHVDHGKTSLLDYIRKSNVVAGEAGGITQHIGAYTVPVKEKFITFLDTPGHQAFTAMRARGAQITDIVVLVVAADDSVMPQTIEAISHANAASVPIVVAMNKIDKPEANPDRIRQQLADHGVLVEEWGGKNQSALISAKKGLNIEQLLEKILLEAELLHLQANPDRRAFGTVIESKLDKGKGAVATVIVQKGTLRVGDPFICGTSSGRVRAMFDHLGQRVDQADPSMPVQLLGFDGVPQAGDQLLVMESESKVKELAAKRQQIKREQDFNQVRHLTLDDISAQIKVGGVQTLKIIVKGDADGSVEALTNELQKLATPEVGVQVIHKAVGPISEADVMLASASDAIIVGFHVRPFPQAKKLAENESVDIRTYRIIYDCVNEIKLALEGLLAPEVKEEIVGTAEIRAVFKISKVGNIAGCMVQDGRINRNDVVRVVRDGFEIFTGRLATLKRVKDDAREVNAGFECGMSFDGYNDIRTGDIVEAVQTVEIKRKLS